MESQRNNPLYQVESLAEFFVGERGERGEIDRMARMITPMAVS